MQLTKTKFRLSKMDCASEEGMVRMALDENTAIKQLQFDLGNRELEVIHDNSSEEVLSKLEPLNLGASIRSMVNASDQEIDASSDRAQESGDLKFLLAINATMFLVEFGTGVYAESTGLIADSLDMLADASVYGLSFLVVYRSRKEQQSIASVSGWLQALLAVGVLLEASRRFFYGSEPESFFMISMGVVALIANIVCLFVIFKHREGGAHMKASWIFSANDVIANAGVILAGVLVAATASNVPDLIIGTIIGLIVLNGARRILAIAKAN